MAQPSDARRELENLAKARIKWVDAQHSAFLALLSEIARNWKVEIAALLIDETTALAGASALLNVTYLQSEIYSQLQKLGYRKLANEFVNRLDGGKANVLSTIKLLKRVDAGRLSLFDDQALSALKSLNLDYLNNLGQSAVSDITRGIVQSTISGEGRAAAIKAISESVDKRLTNYASTYYDTALATYDRELMWQAGEAAGVNKWLYYGPMDIKTRPFCAARVGKSFSREQIDKMRNGTRLHPVSRFGGGWNCRHIWHPDPTESGEPGDVEPEPHLVRRTERYLRATVGEEAQARKALASARNSRDAAKGALQIRETRLTQSPGDPALVAEVASARQAVSEAEAKLSEARSNVDAIVAAKKREGAGR